MMRERVVPSINVGKTILSTCKTMKLYLYTVEDSQASSHTSLIGKELRQLYLALAENK
jgi:hypothetical protein